MLWTDTADRGLFVCYGQILLIEAYSCVKDIYY